MPAIDSSILKNEATSSLSVPDRAVQGYNRFDKRTASPRDIPMQSAKSINLSDFQQLIRTMYYDKDVERGVSGTFMWLMEEIGELSTALRQGDSSNLDEEFADVLAWLATIANVAGVDLSEAVARKYGTGCPGCGRMSCDCPATEKP